MVLERGGAFRSPPKTMGPLRRERYSVKNSTSCFCTRKRYLPQRRFSRNEWSFGLPAMNRMEIAE
jgi:hypothetical protein